MRFKLDFILKNNSDCFRKYLIYYSKKIKDYIKREDNKLYYIETYIAYLKIAKLDNYFYDSLCKEEIEALSEWTSVKQEDYELPVLVNKAFEKWQIVFFSNKYDCLFKQLNPVILGLVLCAIREHNGISKSDLADMMGVNRKTVLLIENGQRFPSLEYIYKFSKAFQTTIDSIIAYSL